MTRMTLFKTLPAAAAALLLAQPDAFGHEAWLLTPSEIEDLSRAPIPDLFTNPVALGIAALLGGGIAIGALRVEDRYRTLEERITAPLTTIATGLGPVLIRFGLSLMMILGALGALPRAGTDPWTQPVLFVPDMQLGLVAGWNWLATVQIILGAFLILGLATRLLALGVIALSVIGLVAFDIHFIAYAPHFIAPALILVVFGGGWLTMDRLFALPPAPELDPRHLEIAWRTVMVLIGATFVYLGIAYKLFQPTLLIAILEHGDFPTFGVPIEIITLAMTGVEIVAGLLLALGRLVRPVAIFLIGAFTFFSVMLGETPLFHANLYGVAAMLLFAGAATPRPLAPRHQPALRLV